MLRESCYPYFKDLLDVDDIDYIVYIPLKKGIYIALDKKRGNVEIDDEILQELWNNGFEYFEFVSYPNKIYRKKVYIKPRQLVHLTEDQSKSMHNALRKSVDIIDEGKLNDSG